MLNFSQLQEILCQTKKKLIPSGTAEDVFFCVIHYDNIHFSCTDADEPVIMQGDINGDTIHLVYVEPGSKHEHYKNPFAVARDTLKRMSK